MKITICMLNEHICVFKKLKFPKTNRSLFNNFQDNLHVVRRSDCFYADILLDLVIKQVGGLTRRRMASFSTRYV